MPANSISIDSLVNAPPISPGIGGWDTLVNQFMQDMRAGRLNESLLARAMAVTPPNSTEGTTLIDCPVGFTIIPTKVIVRNTTTSNVVVGTTFSLGIGTSVSTGNWLHAVNLSTLILSGGVAANSKTATLFPFGANSLTPPGIPLLRGADANLKQFRVRRNNTGNNWPFDFFVFGYCWPDDDPA